TYRATIKQALEQLGHRVTEAEHGLDALGKAMREPPDVILTDVAMPVMDGWQLLRLLRARDATRRVPVVFMSTLASERDRIRGYELGVDDFLSKPVAPSELLARILRVVMRSRWEGAAEAPPDEASMSGDLRQVSLASLLAFAEAERRSGWIHIADRHRRGQIGLRSGVISHTYVNDASAPHSLLEKTLAILDWTEGRFTFRETAVDPSPESVGVQMALMEHARRKDEQNR
ncbi:MAG: response regulator, partial [Sandaracinaceae bacterium]